MKILTGIIGAFFFLFYLPFVTHYGIGEVGIAYNWVSGEVELQGERGFYLSAPWVQVATVETKPVRVCVTSTGRDVGCKLVQFNQKAYREFVAAQGHRYWWWCNRISFNWGYDEEYRGMRDLMRGYAFSVDKYPFITVLSEFHTTN